ncbi:MAG: DUF2062 domain-containing protein [Gallionella sp.]|nr:DUF2062 domain-containing protein [Gallionella sp.]
MRKFFRRFLPHHEVVKNNRWLRPFGRWLLQPNLWHLNRRSVAGGVAVGLLCGLVPGPLQVISSSLLAVWLRVNLPLAIFVTFYTNPFTIVPLYLLAYEMGARISGTHNGMGAEQPVLPQMHWDSWPADMLDWLVQLGQPLLIGLPLLAVSLALAGYFTVRVAWYLAVVWKWRHRHR